MCVVMLDLDFSLFVFLACLSCLLLIVLAAQISAHASVFTSILPAAICSSTNACAVCTTARLRFMIAFAVCKVVAALSNCSRQSFGGVPTMDAHLAIVVAARTFAASKAASWTFKCPTTIAAAFIRWNSCRLAVARAIIALEMVGCEGRKCSLHNSA